MLKNFYAIIIVIIFMINFNSSFIVFAKDTSYLIEQNYKAKNTMEGIAEKQLNFSDWTEDSDGKYRKLVTPNGLRFDQMTQTPRLTTTRVDNNLYLGYSSSITYELKSDYTNGSFVPERSKGFYYTNHTDNYMNIDLTNLSRNYKYEIKYRIYKESGEDSSNIKVSKADGTEFNPAITINTSGGNKLFEGKTEEFSLTSNSFKIKFLASGLNKFYIDYIDIIAVTDKISNVPPKAKTNDLLGQKGNFETNMSIPDISTTGATNTSTGNFKGFAKTGTVSIENVIRDEATNALKINANSELNVQVINLEPNTEYSIFFAAKPGTGGKIEFRASGFKDSTKFNYLNGNNTDSSWDSSSLGLSNMYNWIENLNINIADQWSEFRYDVTTGGNTSSALRVKLKAITSAGHVDDIYIVKRSLLDEISYTLPDPATEISRGHKTLLENGLQIESWMPSDNSKNFMPKLSSLLDLGLTTMQYNESPNFNEALHKEAKDKGIELKWGTAAGPKGKHISSNYQDGSGGREGLPKLSEWKNGFITKERGLEYINNLVNICIGDEEDYSDTLVQNIKSWFELIREKYENGREVPILLHHNEVGNTAPRNLRNISTFNKNMLRKFVKTAKPDMITFDMYYFRERRLNQTVGGTVLALLNDLSRYRIVAREGLDGTGRQPIPFGHYHYSWRTGPGGEAKRPDGWYELSESQVNLYAFALWTWGGKWLSNFRYFDNNTLYLFTDPKVKEDGTYAPYAKYFEMYKEMFRQSKNIGPHILRLQVEEVAAIPGKNLKNGSQVTNGVPVDTPLFTSIVNKEINRNVFIKNINVTNKGKQNNGLNGDVYISYFNILNNLPEKYINVFTSSNPRYFMILNALTAGDGLPTELQQGSSYETRQTIEVVFELPDSTYANKLKKVSRVDGGDTDSERGKVISVPLKKVSGNTYSFETTIGGGLADLYYWELGNKNANTISKQADESGKQNLIEGDTKYANDIITKDLAKKTITIGHIKGTDDLAPMNAINRNMANSNTPGEVLTSSTTTHRFNIAARYYKEDIWNFKL